VKRHDRIDRLSRATRTLRLAQLAVAAWDRIDGTAGAGGTLGPRVSIDDYAAHLQAITAEGRARGIRVVLLTRPYVGSSTDPRIWKTHAPAYNATTLAIAEREGVGVIDVYAAFKERPDVFDDESHFGVEGHHLAAQFIFKELSRIVSER
jgi:hypothetical protein